MNAVRNRHNSWSASFEHVVFAHPQARARRSFSPPLVVDAPEDPGESSSSQTLLVRQILSHAGLSPAHYRAETLRRRIPAVLRLLGCATVEQARRTLREKRELLDRSVSTLLLGVTSFFRDDAVFDTLAARVIPVLARERPFLRIWSIGCSDGAEVVSIAIVLSELGLRDRAYILGMDARQDAINHARTGLVDPAAIAGFPEPIRVRYFLPPSRSADQWQVNWQALPAIGWWEHDAMGVKHAGVWDMILCRNMIMYLAPASAAALWDFILKSLRPGGVVVTGRAERPRGDVPLEYLGPCIFRRRSTR